MLNKFVMMIAVLLMAGCASTPATNFYVLEAVSQPPAQAAKNLKKRLVGIGPITMPPLLDRKQIVTRTLMNGIDVAEFHQWAAPLKDNVLDVLTQNLTQLQPENFIRPYPWSAYGTVNYRVLVDISRFDTRPGIAVNLEASWAIMDESNHRIIDNGRSKISHALVDKSYPATVHALSQVLGQFSLELSLALQKL
ncbi:MAG: PqiC family protein [Methylovulum sp.]|uniref:PqiC family protein n=1 Tax=Methylovulum sp. TaxID=1916980 RepID=UPI00260DF163|nr:PqiC family protein [Methylovulum sp.]MDD2723775.1 PqiC family protein [Methylovulum sp.]MDD5123632.1 PqiC family protein [Methylovulum sp.]